MAAPSRKRRLPTRWRLAPSSALLCALSSAACVMDPADALASLAPAMMHQQDILPTAMPPPPPPPPSIPLDRELYSVAPMMGHTNRHYRHFVRLLGSRRSHLYTEMLPAAQVVRAYHRARGIYLGSRGGDQGDRGGGGSGSSRPASDDALRTDADEILEVVRRVQEDPAKEYRRLPGDADDNLTLHQLLATSASSSGGGIIAESCPDVLQLGGNDVSKLGMAAAIGTAYGRGEYGEINLNCGCPSNAVGGRAGGCALMRQPELVARCVEAMSAGARSVAQSSDGGDDSFTAPPPGITVKHRLGARDALTYDAAADRARDDDEAYGEVRAFVHAVGLAGDVAKFHVHARLGLLGELPEDDDDDDDGDHNNNFERRNKKRRPRQSLWVPGADGELPRAQSIGKIDHKREQERAKRRARKATVKNREVPPLRPNVIHRLAEEFRQHEFVSNGQIGTLDEVRAIVEGGLFGERKNRVVGAMVGRAAINHPCSFAAADTLWDGKISSSAGPARVLPTRGQVLQDYIRYCDEEEERLASYGVPPQVMESLRRRLVAVPFHLFTGEDGSDHFQRHLKKLREKCRNVKASSILTGAASFVPAHSLAKRVDDFIPWEDIAQYEGGLKRGSACQRIVY